MNAKYDRIGITYNSTRKADPYLAEQILKHLNPKPDGRYLDIGCGTGNYTDALQQKGYHFIGIDPSIEMLQKAKLKNSSIDWKLGTAENIELPDESTDGIIATLTIHHWKNIKEGFQEIGRVLKPGGNLVVFTSTPQQMERYWLMHYFPNMLTTSIKQMPALSFISEALKNAGLTLLKTEKYFVHEDLQDLFLQAGKYNPSLYFKPEVRAGISSFASVSNKEEVTKGLTKLENDIRSGKIEKVINEYESKLGDYLFVQVKK